MTVKMALEESETRKKSSFLYRKHSFSKTLLVCRNGKIRLFKMNEEQKSQEHREPSKDSLSEERRKMFRDLNKTVCPQSRIRQERLLRAFASLLKNKF